MSAYACGPGPNFGSEPGAGWAFAEAAAENNDVWVFTRERFREAITKQLSARPELSRHLNPIYIQLPNVLEQRKRRPRDVYWYYLLWQRRAARLMAIMHEEVPFDVGHHVTFASDWLPAGIMEIPDLPLVWGPVGGATQISMNLLPLIGLRATSAELLRLVFTGAARRFWGEESARRADVVVGLNNDVANRFNRITQVVVEPNSAISALPVTPTWQPTNVRRAVFVGRLLGWKGCQLAIATIADPRSAKWTLGIYGEGPDEQLLRRSVDRFGLSDRVIFYGQRPREEVLQSLSLADAMLFPSMHDSAPWAVAEAVSLGCPVVCLDVGGPPILMDGHGIAVSPHADVLEGLVTALADVPPRFKPSLRWSPARLPTLVDGWYECAINNSRIRMK